MDATAWDERYAASDSVWSLTPNQFVEAECAALQPGAALDLAAGEGRNALWLAQRGWRVTAVDYSSVGIGRGRARDGGDSVDWVVGDVLDAPLPAGVDLALLSYLHLPTDERRTVVRRAFGALAPGGTFLFVAHALTNLTRGTGGPQNPDVLCEAADVLADLEGRRYDVVRAALVPRTVAAPTESSETGHGAVEQSTAWDTLVRLTAR